MRNKVFSFILCMIMLMEGGIILQKDYFSSNNEIPVISRDVIVRSSVSDIVKEIEGLEGEIQSVKSNGEVWELKVLYTGNKEESLGFLRKLEKYKVINYSLYYKEGAYNLQLEISRS